MRDGIIFGNQSLGKKFFSISEFQSLKGLGKN